MYAYGAPAGGCGTIKGSHAGVRCPYPQQQLYISLATSKALNRGLLPGHHCRARQSRSLHSRLIGVRCVNDNNKDQDAKQKQEDLPFPKRWALDRSAGMQRYLRRYMRETAQALAAKPEDAEQQNMYRTLVDMLMSLEVIDRQIRGTDEMPMRPSPPEVEKRMREELVADLAVIPQHSAAQADAPNMGLPPWLLKLMGVPYDAETARKEREMLQEKLAILESGDDSGSQSAVVKWMIRVLKEQIAEKTQLEAGYAAQQASASTSQPESAAISAPSESSTAPTASPLEARSSAEGSMGVIEAPPHAQFAGRVLADALAAWGLVAIAQWVTGVDAFEQWAWLRGDSLQATETWLQWTVPYLAAVGAAWWLLPGTSLPWEDRAMVWEDSTRHDEDDFADMPVQYAVATSYSLAFTGGIVYRGFILGLLASFTSGESSATSQLLVDPSYQDEAVRSVLGGLVVPLSLPRLWLAPFFAFAVGALEAALWRFLVGVFRIEGIDAPALRGLLGAKPPMRVQASAQQAMQGMPSMLLGGTQQTLEEELSEAPRDVQAAAERMLALVAEDRGTSSASGAGDELAVTVEEPSTSGWWSEEAIRDFVQPARLAANGTFLAAETLVTGSLVASVATQAAGFLLISALERRQRHKLDRADAQSGGAALSMEDEAIAKDMEVVLEWMSNKALSSAQNIDPSIADELARVQALYSELVNLASSSAQTLPGTAEKVTALQQTMAKLQERPTSDISREELAGLMRTLSQNVEELLREYRKGPKDSD